MPTCVLTAGEQITETRNINPSRRYFDITLDRKAVLNFPNTAQTLPSMAPGPGIPLRMRTLIPQARTTGGGILYARETGWTDTTAVIAPGNLKPQSSGTWEIVLAPVITIATYSKVSAAYWDDFDLFSNWVDSSLMYNLSLAEENQLLNGDGVTPNLEGFLHVVPTAPAGGVSGAGGMLAGIAAGMALVY